MQSPAHSTTLSGGEQRAYRSKTNSSASSMTEAGADSVRSSTDVKCPELLVLGTDLQKKAPLQKLYKMVRMHGTGFW